MILPLSTEEASRLAIFGEARRNDAFRRVIHTGQYSQVVVMTLPPNGEIGNEVHATTDQVFIVAEGVAEARVGDRALAAQANDLVFVAAGVRHNIVNRGQSPLRLVTIYAPPAHPAGTVHSTRAEADAAEAAEA